MTLFFGGITLPEYEDNFDDFNLKWQNTFVYVDNEILFCNGIKSNDEGNTYVELYKRETRFRYPDFDFNSITPIVFDSQFFNACNLDEKNSIKVKKVACLKLSRMPRRQNKRSLSTENTSISCFYTDLLSPFRLRWTHNYILCDDYIRAILAKSFPSYKQALHHCHNHLMVAISPEFAVALSNISQDKYLLASQFGFIGEATENQLFIRHPGSWQEINDFVRRSHLDVEVINAC